MTKSETKFASNAALLGGILFIISVPLWFEIIAAPAITADLTWMAMSVCLLVIAYYSRKLVEPSNPPKWFYLFHIVFVLNAWFETVAAISGQSWGLEYNMGLLDAVWLYCLFQYAKDRVTVWCRAGIGIMGVMSLLDGAYFALAGGELPDAVAPGWILGILLLFFGFWQAYKELETV